MATIVPGFAFRSGPPFASSSCTSRSKPTQTRIASLSAARDSGLAAHWAPSFFTAFALAALRSHARVANPLRARCPMIGVPMRPAPTTPTAFRPWGTAAFFMTGLLALLRDGVEQRRCPGLYLGDRALERRGDVLRLVDRAFRVPAHGLRHRGEVRFGVAHVYADVRALDRRAAQLGHPDLVLPVVVVGAVVVHDDQQRDAVLRRNPHRARVEHEIAVGLYVDDEAFLVAVRERHPQRDSELRGGAERASGVAIGPIEIPE